LVAALSQRKRYGIAVGQPRFGWQCSVKSVAHALSAGLSEHRLEGTPQTIGQICRKSVAEVPSALAMGGEAHHFDPLGAVCLCDFTGWCTNAHWRIRPYVVPEIATRSLQHLVGDTGGALSLVTSCHAALHGISLFCLRAFG